MTEKGTTARLESPPQAEAHLFTGEILKRTILPPHPDSHKGQNGRILVVIGGSPLFHGAGRLAASASSETFAAINVIASSYFASRSNDMVYLCTSDENLHYLKQYRETFIGIKRIELNEYLAVSDVVVVGPGLQRVSSADRPETRDEPTVTRQMTQQVIKSGKKAVLDAGSLQVVDPEILAGQHQLILTPHRQEMARLFRLDQNSLVTAHSSSFGQMQDIAHIVQSEARRYGVTILLKGPIDIIADSNHWLFSPGGHPGMTKGGTGDVLAGVVGALYGRIADPLLAAGAASYLTKRVGESLAQTNLQFFDATDLAFHVGEKLTKILAWELSH